MSQEGDSEELLGRIWCDRYQILEYVGRGGMGAVYKAKQVHIGREVALKVIHRRLCKDDKQIQRFEQEARTSSKLNHPNSIRVFDYGKSDDGRLFMAMEFLRGKTLGKLISEQGTLPPRQVAHIARQMFKSLAEAHQLGLVHRDLKPENIFICDIFGETDFVKVLDFGIAKAIGPTEEDAKLTQTGFICGTPRYLSPEQALGQEVDGRADLYSVGVLMYEMLTGRPPFVGENPISIVMKHVHDEPPPMTGLERHGEEVHQLVSLVSHLLQKNPARRPSPAERIVQFLDGSIDHTELMGSAAPDGATAQRRMPSSLQNLSGLTSPHLPSSQLAGSPQQPEYRDPDRGRPIAREPNDEQPPSRVRRTRAPAPPPLPFEAIPRQAPPSREYDPQADATVLTARPQELLGATITEASQPPQDAFLAPTFTEASPPSAQVTSVISRSSSQSPHLKPPSSPTINIQKRPSEPPRATIKRPETDRARINPSAKERQPPTRASSTSNATTKAGTSGGPGTGPVWAWALAVMAVVSMVAYGLFGTPSAEQASPAALKTEAAELSAVKAKPVPASTAPAPPLAAVTPKRNDPRSASSEVKSQRAPEPPPAAGASEVKTPGARVGMILSDALELSGPNRPTSAKGEAGPAGAERPKPEENSASEADMPKEALPVQAAKEPKKTEPKATPKQAAEKPKPERTPDVKAREVKQPNKTVKAEEAKTPVAKEKEAPKKRKKAKKRKKRPSYDSLKEAAPPKPKRRPKPKPKKKAVDFEVF